MVIAARHVRVGDVIEADWHGRHPVSAIDRLGNGMLRFRFAPFPFVKHWHPDTELVIVRGREDATG
jgi:hypothetical protein